MSKTSLDAETIHTAVCARLGPVTGLRQLAEGGMSQAFGFHLDGVPHVVRVSADLAAYEKERFVLERLAPPEAPVAPIVDIWQHDAAHAMCVSLLLDGFQVKGVDTDTARRIAGQVVRVHQAIAGADISVISGFGMFDAHAQGRSGSWPDFLLGDIDETPELPPGPRAVYDDVRLALARAAPSCPDIRCLVHGDFGGDNLLTDGVVVTGVLDWAFALVGDPVYDVAWSIFWGEWVAPMRVHGDALWAARHGEPDADVRLRACILHIGLSSTRYFLHVGRPETAYAMTERARHFATTA